MGEARFPAPVRPKATKRKRTDITEGITVRATPSWSSKRYRQEQEKYAIKVTLQTGKRLKRVHFSGEECSWSGPTYSRKAKNTI